jgi:hypothetical protein
VGLCLAVVVAFAFARSGTAYAQTQALGDAEVQQRLERIQTILDERTGRAQFWQYGWMGLGYAVTAGFAGGSALTSNKTNRLDFAFAAGGAFIDTTAHMLDPIRVHAAERLREQPASTPGEARSKLKFAESELAAVAEAEAGRQSLLKAHVLPDGLPVVTGLILWLGFGHRKGAAINTAAAIAVNEVRVLTQPTSTVAAWKQYQQNAGYQPSSSAGHRPAISWSLAVGPFGSYVYGSF